MKNFIYFCLACAWVCCLASCKSQQKEEEHHHEHAICLTAYSTNMELYAEMSPLEKDEEATLLLHCTWLNTFKPLKEGSAEIKINGIDKVETVIKADSLDKPGIFKLHFTPKKAGNVSIQILIQSKEGNNSFSFTGLKAFANEEEAHEDAEKREIAAANGVAFPKELSWNIDFSTEVVRMESLGQVIHATAQITPSINEETSICATVSGVVNFTSNQLTEGQVVNKGQSLFRIDGTKTASGNLAVESSKALADFQLAKKQYERARTLIKDKLITQSELDEAKSNYETAAAVYRNTQKNYKTGIQVLNVPRKGYITQLCVTDGDFVTEGQTLAVIGQNNTVYIQAEVPSSYYNQLNGIQDATFKCNDTQDDTYHSIHEFGGKVLSYGKQTATGNPLLPVIFELKNNGTLVPGSFVDMYITTQGGEISPIIPSEAIMEDMGNYFVYVQMTPELFEKRLVKLGNTNGKLTAIQNGLKANERVVVKGAVLVKLQQSTGSVDPHSGHTH